MGRLPDGLTLERNRDLQGLLKTPWLRRLLLCLVAALPVLALIGVFGQRSSTVAASTPAASLSVTAPSRLRGGLLFQARIEVVPRREIHHLELVLDGGWFEAMSVNSTIPEPESESSRDGKVVFDYGSWPAGKTLVSWINFQVNPTNLGTTRENVTLEDAGTPLARVHRSLTVFP
jgi:hypothetical protein